jgi:hypothetical protein
VGEDRAYCLDWLRVLAFFVMVPYHVSLIFTTRAWFVSDEQSPEFASLMRVPNYFRVPLLFFVSGYVVAKVHAAVADRRLEGATHARQTGPGSGYAKSARASFSSLRCVRPKVWRMEVGARVGTHPCSTRRSVTA